MLLVIVAFLNFVAGSRLQQLRRSIALIVSEITYLFSISAKPYHAYIVYKQNREYVIGLLHRKFHVLGNIVLKSVRVGVTAFAQTYY